MATSFTATPTNALNQKFLGKRVFRNRHTPIKLFQKLLDKASKSVMVGDDLRVKSIAGQGHQFEYAGAGTAISQGGQLFIREYPFFKKTLAVPYDFDLPMLLDLDPENNDKDAVTLNNYIESVYDRADTMREWAWLSDGTGAITSVATTAITNGKVYLASTTPRMVFDRLLQYNSFVTVGTQSAGAITEQACDSNNYKLRGYIVAKSFADKSITLGITPNTTGASAAGYASYDVASVTASQYLYFAPIPATIASTTASSGVLMGVESTSNTADAETFPQMHGVLRLNEYHSSSSYYLYGVNGYATDEFNPVHLAGSSSKGLLPEDIQTMLNDAFYANEANLVFATDPIIWTDWCSQYRTQNQYNVVNKGAANIEAGFEVNGKIVPLDVVPYWTGKGLLHLIDTETLHVIYTPSKVLRRAGMSMEPAWMVLHEELAHPSTSYYALVNQIAFRGNLVCDGRRNRNFVEDGLQTTALYNA